MKANLTNPVPDLAEAVTYTRDGRTDRMRVDGWYCLQKVAKPKSDHVSKIITELIREDPTSMGYRLMPCPRRKATVVSLYAIAGALVRIDDPGLVREGKYIEWSPAFIKEEKKSWAYRVRRLSPIDGLGRGYRDTLERLFPEVDLSYPY